MEHQEVVQALVEQQPTGSSDIGSSSNTNNRTQEEDNKGGGPTKTEGFGPKKRRHNYQYYFGGCIVFLLYLLSSYHSTQQQQRVFQENYPKFDPTTATTNVKNNNVSAAVIVQNKFQHNNNGNSKLVAIHNNDNKKKKHGKFQYTKNDNYMLHRVDPTAKRISVMHVGKTGGTTLRFWVLKVGCNSLGDPDNRKTCLERQSKQQPESQLSLHTKAIQHAFWIFPGPLALAGATHFLFTTRNPVRRFISWYYHERRGLSKQKVRPGSFRHAFLNGCFPSLNSIGDALQTNSSILAKKVSFSQKNKEGSHDNIISKCSDLLHATFRGAGKDQKKQAIVHEGERYSHMTYDYRFYYRAAKMDDAENNNDANANKTVWILRTENFWDDVQQLENLLGGRQGQFDDIQSVQEDHGSKGEQHDVLTGAAMQRVCCALWPDMVAYRKIVDRAANLNATEKETTYQQTWKDCHVSSWEMLYQNCRQTTKNLSVPFL